MIYVYEIPLPINLEPWQYRSYTTVHSDTHLSACSEASAAEGRTCLYILLFLLQIRMPGNSLSGKDKVVCLATFAGLYGITQARVQRHAVAMLELRCPPLDRRGRYSGQHKISDTIKKIEHHIRSFPVMKSHYSS